MTQAKVVYSTHNNSVCIKAVCNDEIVWDEIQFDLSKVNQGEEQFLLFWLLNGVKSVFFTMPFDDIALEYSQGALEKFKDHITFVQNCLNNTNQVIKALNGHRKAAASYDCTLLYNVDETPRFVGLFEKLKSLDAQRTHYMNFSSGFNPVLRQWEDADVPMTIDALISTMIEKKIKKVISLNHYLLERYLFKNHLFLVPIFDFLGIEYVVVDNDPWDQSTAGYLIKKFYNHTGFKRFSFETLHHHWDDKYKMSNVTYVTVPNTYESKSVLPRLNNPYEVVVLSKSRIDQVMSMINPLLYILEHMDPDSIVYEIELWFYSLRHMILKMMPLNEFDQLRCNSLLFNFFYTITQFVKFITIDELDKDIPLSIYGDVGWQKVFPEQYKKYLSKPEMDELFSKNDKIFLLLNWQTSWLNASGPIYDAISRNIPFLSYPALVHTAKLEGLKMLEYNNAAQLKDKIQNINHIVTDEKLCRSLVYLKQIYNESMDGTVDIIMNNKQTDSYFGEYGQQRLELDEVLDREIKAYIDKKELFLRQSFNALFIQPAPFDGKNSRYFSRPFFQQMITQG